MYHQPETKRSKTKQHPVNSKIETKRECGPRSALTLINTSSTLKQAGTFLVSPGTPQACRLGNWPTPAPPGRRCAGCPPPSAAEEAAVAAVGVGASPRIALPAPCGTPWSVANSQGSGNAETWLRANHSLSQSPAVFCAVIIIHTCRTETRVFGESG